MKQLFYKKAGQNYMNYVKTYMLPEFQKGSLLYGDDLLKAFVIAEDPQFQIEIANACEELLSQISVKKLIWLSEQFRCGWYDDGILYGDDIDWLHRLPVRERYAYLSDGQYGAVMKLGTFVENGYYRQSCMEALQDFDGVLPFLILRLNDWVVQVREAAYRIAEQRVRTCGVLELFGSLPMLEKVRASRRRNGEHILLLDTRMRERMQSVFGDMTERELEKIPDYDIQTKNAVYRFLYRNKVLETGQMRHLLMREKTGYGKTLLLLGIFAQDGYDRDSIREFLSDKSAVVRYHALLYRYEKEHAAWPELKGMLLDKSCRIRTYAGYILEKHAEFKVLDYYLENLSERVTKEILLGIAEYGTRKEEAVILPFLESEDEQITKTALTAYGKLAQEKGDAVYWRFVDDCRQVVARQAYRCITKYSVCYGASSVYEAFLHNQDAASGEYFLRILLRESSWERLPYLLTLYGDGTLSEEFHQLVLAGINVRAAYAKVSARQAQDIRDILEERADVLPQSVREEILFDLKFVTQP